MALTWIPKSLSICHSPGTGRKGDLYSARSSMLVFNTLYLESDPGPIFGVLFSQFFKVTRFCLNCKTTVFPSFGYAMADKKHSKNPVWNL